jgi:abortive infection bacteriophage resistance protein
MNFTKKPKTFLDQIALLKIRGLKIEDEARALHHLSNISYYRLSAYLLSFQRYGDPSHTYMPWASFNRVMRLYVYDRELRGVLLDAIERIEVALRCRIVYEYCHLHGTNWYENSSLFLRQHNKFMTLVNSELRSSKETFIQHYFSKYSTPQNPPAWMAMEVLSFGQLSTMFKNLRTDPAKKAVANYFGINHTILESWMEHLVYIRNLCAHHNRVWNRTMTVKATMPNITAYQWISKPPSKIDKLYPTLCILAYLLERVTQRATFYGKMKTLLNRFPDIDTNASGFPKNWDSDPFWSNLYMPLTHQIRIVFFRSRNYLTRKRSLN